MKATFIRALIEPIRRVLTHRTIYRSAIRCFRPNIDHNRGNARAIVLDTARSKTQTNKGTSASCDLTRLASSRLKIERSRDRRPSEPLSRFQASTGSGTSLCPICVVRETCPDHNSRASKVKITGKGAYSIALERLRGHTSVTCRLDTNRSQAVVVQVPPL